MATKTTRTGWKFGRLTGATLGLSVVLGVLAVIYMEALGLLHATPNGEPPDHQLNVVVGLLFGIFSVILLPLAGLAIASVASKVNGSVALTF